MSMSLVDYASSDDDVSEEENKENQPAPLPTMVADGDHPHPPTRPPHTQSVVSSYQRPESTGHSSAPSVEKLPDASLLFDSPDLSPNMLSSKNHFSHLAQSASRKRESSSSVSSIPRSKLPKSNLPHSKNVPDTVGGMLVPPQLSGRSNVVTEDVGKLFVKKQAGASPPQ